MLYSLRKRGGPSFREGRKKPQENGTFKRGNAVGEKMKDTAKPRRERN